MPKRQQIVILLFAALAAGVADMSGRSFNTTATKLGVWKTTQLQNIGGVWKFSTNSGTELIETLNDFKSSHSSLNYFRVVKDGGVLSQQPFVRYKRVRYHPVRQEVTKIISGADTGAGTTYVGPIGSPLNECDLDFNRVFTSAANLNQRNEAIIKLRQKLKNMDVNLAQVVAERQLAINLVGDTIFKLAKAAQDVKHGKIPKLGSRGLAGKVAKGPQGRFVPGQSGSWEQNFARNWLEFQYGWRPMLNDIDGACKALAGLKYPSPVISKSATATRNYHDMRTTRGTSKVVNYNIEVKRDWKFTAHVKIDYPLAHTLASLGLTNPASIAWELTPWSFVVDWALPIGPWIEGFDAMVGLSPITTSETTYIKGFTFCEAVEDVKSTTSTRTTIDRSRYEVEELNRQIIDGVPSAFVPYLKNPLSTEHVANALALLVGVFHGKR